MNLEALKARAAEAAVKEIRSGTTIGLGTGSTVAHLLTALSAALKSGALRDVRGVPTSERTGLSCAELGIPVTSLEEAGELDVAIDGADEVSPELDLIKGLGGALLREKMVACAARRFIVIADQTKEVQRLGSRSPLPVEVIPFAWKSHLPFLRSLDSEPGLRLGRDGEPYRTDNGNLVLDCRFPAGISDAAALERELEHRPGVVDSGLFLGLCTRVYVASPAGVLIRDRG